MLRINLLPAYVAQRRLTAKLRFGFIALFIIIVAGMLVWNTILINNVRDETAKANDAVAAHQQIDTLNGEASSTLAQIGPIKNKVDFYNAVMKSNVEAPDLFSRIARWTSPAIYYTDMSVNGGTLDIKGYTKSIADLNRYLQYMYTEPDVVNVGLVTALPTFSSAMIPVTFYKGQQITVGAQAGQGGPPVGFGGPPAGFGGPLGGRGGPPNMGGNVPNQAALMDPGLANALATGAGTTTGYRRADSFTFEVQCQLKVPLNPPGDPSAAAGAGGAAGAANTMGAPMGGA